MHHADLGLRYRVSTVLQSKAVVGWSVWNGDCQMCQALGRSNLTVFLVVVQPGRDLQCKIAPTIVLEEHDLHLTRLAPLPLSGL